LFTAGDTICYFFGAENDDVSPSRTYWTEFVGTTPEITLAAKAPIEAQVLPTDLDQLALYVDAWDGLGAQPYFDTAFRMLGISDDIDRFDYRVAESDQGNGLGNKVPAPGTQLMAYRNILLCTGDIDYCGVDDGTQKPDDALALTTFLTLRSNAGLYWSGNSAGTDLYRAGGLASLVALRGFLAATVLSSDHESFGLGFTPRLVARSSGIFDHQPIPPFSGPDTLMAGGCPQFPAMDVLTNFPGISRVEMDYHGNTIAGGAIITQVTSQGMGDSAYVVLSGVSYHSLRNGPGPYVVGIPDRVDHLEDIFIYMYNVVPNPTGAKPIEFANRLDQNYPNPFNPQTTIAFSLKDKAHVSMRIYNVAGQVVATLLDEVRAAGVYRDVTWSGQNNAGQSVSSGVYFYRLVTKNFVETRKMVLLK
jgi:hypothetical protein